MTKRGSKRKPSAKRAMKDLPATKTHTVTGGTSLSNIIKTKQETVQNSISNVR